MSLFGWVWVCVSVRTECTYICMNKRAAAPYVFTWLGVGACECTYICMNIFIYICVYMYAYIHTYIHACLWCVYHLASYVDRERKERKKEIAEGEPPYLCEQLLHMCSCACACVYGYIHMYACINTHTYIHTYKHTCIHTYMQTPKHT